MALIQKDSRLLIGRKDDVPWNVKQFRSGIVGGLTGAINICVVFPVEFVKTRLQLDTGKTLLTAHHSVLNVGRGYSPIATALLAQKIK